MEEGRERRNESTYLPCCCHAMYSGDGLGLKDGEGRGGKEGGTAFQLRGRNLEGARKRGRDGEGDVPAGGNGPGWEGGGKHY